MDRQVISYLKEYFCTATEQGGFGWTNSDYANVTTVFTGFYAGMTILAGWVIDRIGTKLGLALSLIIWSVFGIANAFVGSLAAAHMVVRSLFGIGEAGNFPASIKTVAEWFPKRERALATGIFNSGSNVGAMISALFVPWCLIHFGDRLGWKMAFILTGAIGFIWLIFWFWLYAPPAQQKRLSKAEFDYIHSDQDETKSQEQQDDKSAKKVSGSLFSFAGRMSQAGFVGITSMIIFLCLFVYFISTLFPSLSRTGAFILYGTVGVVAFWASLAAQSRRWHDLGKPGGYILLNLLPGVGTLVSILMLATRPGAAGANRFGESARPELLGYRQTWAFFFGKFFTDGVWWFYLFWLPSYFTTKFHLDLLHIGPPLIIVYNASAVGSIGGGWLPTPFRRWGLSPMNARLAAMLVCALAVVPIFTVNYLHSEWVAIVLFSLAAGGHCGWSANLLTTPSDMFDRSAVGSVTGIGGMAGSVGGILFAGSAGYILQWTHNYASLFAIAASVYLLALGLMALLAPGLKKAELA